MLIGIVLAGRSSRAGVFAPPEPVGPTAMRWALVAALSIGCAPMFGCNEAVVSLLQPPAAADSSSEADARGRDAADRDREDLGAKKDASDLDGEEASELDAQNDRYDAVSLSTADSGDAASQTAVAAQYVGCFADSAVLDLPHLTYSDPTNTIEHCLAACVELGYLYAGMRGGNDCFCADSYGGQGPSNGCIIPCGGNASETCGGTSANSVYYTTTPPPPLQYLGCFLDKGMRDLAYEVYDTHSSTAESCVADCSYHGYSYAGTQAANQCFCGDTYGSYGPSTSCNLACGGNASETCGGYYANSVYRTGRLADAGSD